MHIKQLFKQMVIEYSSPHKDLASILLYYHKEKFFRRSEPLHFPYRNTRGRKDRDYHCDRYTPLNTLEDTIITTV